MKNIIIAFSLFLSSYAFAATPICGTSDDTASIQAIVDSGDVVELPGGPGVCKVCSVNGTNRSVTMIGKGPTSQIWPICSAVRVLDFTGSGTVTLDKFRLCGYCTPGIVPQVGILTAFSNINTADVFTMSRVRVDGSFTAAALYVYQTASSSISFSQIYNYQPTAVTMVMTGNNLWNISSSFSTINPNASSVPSDWSMFQLEIHNLGNNNGLWIGGAQSVRFFGGNISSSAIPVSINAVVNATGGISMPGNMIFDGTTFYNDFAPTPPCAIQNNAGSAGIPIFQANQRSMPTLLCP